MTTTVVNVKHGPCDVYVGRAFGAYTRPSRVNPVPGRFGNPFKSGGISTRVMRQRLVSTYFDPWLRTSGLTLEQAAQVRFDADSRMCNGDALAAFTWYLDLRAKHDAAWKRDVLALRGKRLGCWCVDRDGNGPCHARVLAEWIDAQPLEAT